MKCNSVPPDCGQFMAKNYIKLIFMNPTPSTMPGTEKRCLVNISLHENPSFSLPGSLVDFQEDS